LNLDILRIRLIIECGAGPAEIAYDRRMIARDRRILAAAHGELEHDRGYGWRDSGWSGQYGW
jgi:hypothetical protein